MSRSAKLPMAVRRVKPYAAIATSGNELEGDVAERSFLDVGEELSHLLRHLGHFHRDDGVLREASERSSLLREQRARDRQLVAHVSDRAQERRVATEAAERRSIAREEYAHRIGLGGGGLR